MTTGPMFFTRWGEYLCELLSVGGELGPVEELAWGAPGCAITRRGELQRRGVVGPRAEGTTVGVLTWDASRLLRCGYDRRCACLHAGCQRGARTAGLSGC